MQGYGAEPPRHSDGGAECDNQADGACEREAREQSGQVQPLGGQDGTADEGDHHPKHPDPRTPVEHGPEGADQHGDEGRDADDATQGGEVGHGNNAVVGPEGPHGHDGREGRHPPQAEAGAPPPPVCPAGQGELYGPAFADGVVGHDLSPLPVRGILARCFRQGAPFDGWSNERSTKRHKYSSTSRCSTWKGGMTTATYTIV